MSNQSNPYLTDKSGQEHTLEANPTRIGRGIENEIVIVSKLSSREHAVIHREGRRSNIEDLGSTNGTFLNGERVQGSIPLRDGDQLLIGGLKFTFHDPEMTSRETPFPELDINLAAGEVRLNRRLVQLSPRNLHCWGFCSKIWGVSVQRTRLVAPFGRSIRRACLTIRSKIWYDVCAVRSRPTRTHHNCC